MSHGSNIKSKLFREGTSQKERMPEALSPDYIKIDERNIDALINFAKNFSEHIQYYNKENKADGDWKVFFNNISKADEPHFALFLTFLELFKKAQEHINTLTKEHLDFYFRDVLGFKENPAVPDKVSILFELAKNINTYLLPAETALSAGKDKTGVEIIYKTTEDIVLNKANADSLKTVFLDNNYEGRLFAAPAANSEDGAGKKITASDGRWHAFGESQFGKSTDSRSMQDAEIGFAFASPLLLLKEGNRNVLLSFTFNEHEKLNKILKLDFDNAFTAYFTGEKEWLGPYTVNVRAVTKKLILEISIEESNPSILAYNSTFHGSNFNTKYPLIKILLNNNKKPFLYNYIKKLLINKVSIKVNVEGAKNLILQNDQSKLDPNKPFNPFGSVPVVGSAFYIGHEEFTNKKLDTLKLNIEWSGLPDDITNYYNSYGYPYVKENFKALVSYLQNKKWITNNQKIQLFNDNDINRKISISKINTSRSITDSPVQALDNSVNTGFLKLSLVPIDFGHSIYPKLYAGKAIELSKYTGDVSDAPVLPNQPYTPLIKSLSINYSSEEEIFFIRHLASEAEQYFYIEPFGQKLIPVLHPVNLLPVYESEGQLYIGINGLVPPQNISLLFQVAEGTADPETEVDDNKIKWHYLSNNNWKEFNKLSIISDTTNNFRTSGIISISVPDDINNENTLMPDELFWLRISIEENSTGVCQLIDIKTQAVAACFADNGNDPDYLKEVLVANSISKLQNKISSIKTVSQPYTSANGKPIEQDDELYRRISERLRHKKRAITIWDIERLVLENFPAIYKTKCLRSTSNISELQPGYITLIVIENLYNKNAVNPLEPKASADTLSNIKDYLENYISPFVNLEVQNPVYEKVKVHCKVKFMQGYDDGYYGTQLNEDIKKFLSPWAYKEGQDIVFGGKIYKSAILDFIEEREYVDYVLDFRLSHITRSLGIGYMYIRNKNTEEYKYEDFVVGDPYELPDVEVATANNARVILVSEQQHDIYVLKPEECLAVST
ncbi:MAG: baseplate J/gp47 family protein [Bacteroidales bacterium]|jgi:hypothetical protein